MRFVSMWQKWDILMNKSFNLLSAGEESGKIHMIFTFLFATELHVYVSEIICEFPVKQSDKFAKSLRHRSSSIRRYQFGEKRRFIEEWETSRCNNISPHPSVDTTQLDLISNARFHIFQSLAHSLSRPKWKSKVPLKQFKYVFLTTFLFGCLLFHDVALVENEKGLQTPCVGGCEVVEWTDFIITTKTE